MLQISIETFSRDFYSSHRCVYVHPATVVIRGMVLFVVIKDETFTRLFN